MINQDILWLILLVLVLLFFVVTIGLLIFGFFGFGPLAEQNITIGEVEDQEENTNNYCDNIPGINAKICKIK